MQILVIGVDIAALLSATVLAATRVTASQVPGSLAAPAASGTARGSATILAAAWVLPANRVETAGQFSAMESARTRAIVREMPATPAEIAAPSNVMVPPVMTHANAHRPLPANGAVLAALSNVTVPARMHVNVWMTPGSPVVSVVRFRVTVPVMIHAPARRAPAKVAEAAGRFSAMARVTTRVPARQT